MPKLLPLPDHSHRRTGLRVLGLFDGIATGLAALKAAGAVVERYAAAETDPWACAVASANHLEIEHLGDARTVDAAALGDIDILIGGPPCQSFSVAGDGAGFSDPRGNLVLEYVKVRDLLNPRFFLMENVPMGDADERRITGLLGVRPVRLDSARWSAQKRIRLYWTNVPLGTAPASDLVIADVMECGGLDWLPDGVPRSRTTVRAGTIKGGGQGDRIYHPMGKAPTLNAHSGGTAGSGNLLAGNAAKWRKLTLTECERLQTLPDHYTAAASGRHRRRLIGNGWTLRVIQYLLSGVVDP
jgi:site-specific DNA-cytosine methylase